MMLNLNVVLILIKWGYFSYLLASYISSFESTYYLCFLIFLIFVLFVYSRY